MASRRQRVHAHCDISQLQASWLKAEHTAALHWRHMHAQTGVVLAFTAPCTILMAVCCSSIACQDTMRRPACCALLHFPGA